MCHKLWFWWGRAWPRITSTRSSSTGMMCLEGSKSGPWPEVKMCTIFRHIPTVLLTLHTLREADIPACPGMRTSRVRSLAWRVFLGVFPSGAFTASQWLESQAAKRKEYDGHCENFLVDPYKVCVTHVPSMCGTMPAKNVALVPSLHLPHALYFREACLTRVSPNRRAAVEKILFSTTRWRKPRTVRGPSTFSCER